MQETRVQSLCWETPWRRKKEPTLEFMPGESHVKIGGLQSMGSQRVRHDRANNTHTQEHIHIRETAGRQQYEYDI